MNNFLKEILKFNFKKPLFKIINIYKNQNKKKRKINKIFKFKKKFKKSF